MCYRIRNECVCVQVVFSLVHLTVWYCFHLPQLFSTFCAQQCIFFSFHYSCLFNTDQKGTRASGSEWKKNLIHIFINECMNVEKKWIFHTLIRTRILNVRIFGARDGERERVALSLLYEIAYSWTKMNERVSDDSKIGMRARRAMDKNGFFIFIYDI